MKVLALDPSSTIIGYACMSDMKSIIEAGRIRAHSGDDWTIVQKVDTMLGELRQTLDTCRPEEIVIEIPAPQAPPMKHGNRGQANYGLAVGMVIAECRAWVHSLRGPDDLYYDVPLHFVRVDVWARGQKKAARAEWICRLFPQYRMARAKDAGMDIADAISLCMWWMQHGRLKQVDSPRVVSRPSTPQSNRKPKEGTLFAA